MAKTARTLAGTKPHADSVCSPLASLAPVTRFDLYVTVRFLAATLLLLGLLIVVFVVLDYVEFVDDFMDRGATLGDVFGRYYLHYVPEIVRLVSPLAVFLGAIYVTARLAQSMQLAALQSAGVSTLRYARPFLVVGVLITAVMFGFNGWVVPRSLAIVHAFQGEYYRDAPEREGGAEMVLQTAPDAVLAVGFFDRDAGRAFRISAIRLDTTGGLPQGIRARLDAAEMTWVDSLALWQMRDVSSTRFGASGSVVQRSLGSLDTALAIHPRDLARNSRDAERMTLPEAAEYVESLERVGVRERGRPVVALHAKLAYPLANLILVLLAIPLASRRRKGGQAAQLAIGLGVAFIYLALQKTIEPLGYVEDLPPVLAAWLPHAVFAVVGVWMLLRSRQA